MEQFLTQAAFARLRGVARKTVTHWKNLGLLVFAPDGRIDVAASEARIDARPEVRKGGKTNRRAPAADLAPSVAAALDAVLPEAASWTTSEANRRKEIALALTRQLEYDLKAENAVEIASVVATVQAEYGILRDRLLQLPGKLSDRVTGLPDRHEVESIRSSLNAQSVATLKS
jgi:hypothetical protein